MIGKLSKASSSKDLELYSCSRFHTPNSFCKKIKLFAELVFFDLFFSGKSTNPKKKFEALPLFGSNVHLSKDLSISRHRSDQNQIACSCIRLLSPSVSNHQRKLKLFGFSLFSVGKPNTKKRIYKGYTY